MLTKKPHGAPFRHKTLTVSHSSNIILDGANSSGEGGVQYFIERKGQEQDGSDSDHIDCSLLPLFQ